MKILLVLAAILVAGAVAFGVGVGLHRVDRSPPTTVGCPFGTTAISFAPNEPICK